MYKILMFISSYFPLYMIIIITKYRYLNESKIGKLFLLIIFIMMMSSIISMFIVLTSSANTYRNISSIEKSDDSVISYLMSYVIPLYSIQDNTIEYVMMNTLLFFIISVLYIRLDLLYLNPVFALLGYVHYNSENFVIISNIKYIDLINVINNKNDLHVYEVTDTIFLARKKDNNI
ncbi:hypothetical protein HMPREF9629_00640 [Peptoanaerobacter stomatis]|uniref:Uncharacterized protein n=1 Tax=Peptoanaerobacter stomatis TaxID=796937 RepID=G9X2N3_9FIRM|nr:hypothetical protein [Peptoanaerobacter stomatis]EHL11103.1 hypothetical protein HMPREF9629_00640 [Peptoanaerobacter stomatis]